MIKPTMMMFAKSLQSRPLDEAARRIKAIGLDHIDLTVRPGGFVEPERVDEDLPRAAEQLRQAGVSIGMLTTAITTLAEPYAEATLRAAAALGVRHYKLGYLRYPHVGTLRQLRREALECLREIAALNRELGLIAGYHNHSGSYLGASLHDVAWLLDRLPREAIGAYLDPAHAAIEGGGQAGLMGLDLLGDRVVMLAVKDFYWADAEAGGAHVGRRHAARFCPLDQGQTAWPRFLEVLDRFDFAGPVSLHSEYRGAASFKELSVDELLEQTRCDAATLERWLACYTHIARTPPE